MRVGAILRHISQSAFVRRHLKTYFIRTAFVILPRFGKLTDGGKEPPDFLCHHCASVYVIIIIISALIYNFTGEITLLPWQLLVLNWHPGLKIKEQFVNP